MRSSDACHIGVLLDHCGGDLSEFFDDGMIDFVSSLPGVTTCEHDDNLAVPERLKKAMERIKTSQADRVVIVGGSPRRYERSFHRSIENGDLNPYLFRVANIREGAAWIGWDKQGTREKAMAIVARAVRAATAIKPVGQETAGIPRKAIVIGAGIVGMRTALALAEVGVKVALLTRAKDIGGKALQLTHFYDGPDDAAPWHVKQIEQVRKHSNIEIKTSVELRSCTGCLGDYRVAVQNHTGSKETVEGAVVIVATGYDVLPNSERKTDNDRFVSPSQLESLLQNGGRLEFEKVKEPIETVTIVFDLVNETIKIDGVNAIKNAILLRETYGCTVYVVCRDVKVALDGMEAQYRKAREIGVRFIKYDKPPRFSAADGGVHIDVEEVSTLMRGDRIGLSILSDLVVLSEGFGPSKGNESVARALGIPFFHEGYLMEDNPQFLHVRANARGIFIAGGCRYPQTLDEALVEAEAAASAVSGLLLQGVYSYDLAVAEVEGERCSACMTCFRVCPHSAIRMENYARRNIYTVRGYKRNFKWGAARVEPRQCYGCGICVSSCPTKAIELKHQIDAEISLQMEG
jgi:heterodisulfide reductase subunit A